MTKFPEKPEIIGKIIGVYGVKGYVKIASFTEKMSDIFNYVPWFVWFRFRWKLLSLESWKLIKKYYIVKFIDFNSREFAMLFNTMNVVVDKSTFPLLYGDEYYWTDIIGCQVITMKKNKLGYVLSIIETVAHDILVVNNGRYNITKTEDFLIPFVWGKIIKSINLQTNSIVVDWSI